MENKTITIFGSSMPLPGEKEYEDAYYIGKALAKEGFNICSGGSMGIMDAVSKGAAEEGREAIGVTVEIFNSKSTPFLTREIKCSTLFERLDNLVNIGDGYVILPGGTGTMLEISLVWEMIIKDLMKSKPTTSFGNLWKNIVYEMEERIKSENRKLNLIKCFDDRDLLIKFMKENLR